MDPEHGQARQLGPETASGTMQERYVELKSQLSEKGGEMQGTMHQENGDRHGFCHRRRHYGAHNARRHGKVAPGYCIAIAARMARPEAVKSASGRR